MLPYTIDENLTYGYRHGIFNPEDKLASDSMICTYARASREPGTFREETVETAKLIAQQAASLNRRPVVMLSGGMDSEVVVKAFIEAGVNFTATTFRFPDRLNAHELYFVDHFAKSTGIEIKYFDLDIKNWARSTEARMFFINSRAHFFEMIPHMKLMQEIWDSGGFPVLGNGDVYLEKTSFGWDYTEFEYILAWFRFAISQKILGGIAFFQHTPEMTLAMLREPKIEECGTGKNKLANMVLTNSRQLKYSVYKKHWPELLSRRKFNGGEFLHPLYNELAVPLRTGFNDKWQMPYILFRDMIEP